MQEYKVTVDEQGTIRWYQDDLLHRLEGPAIEYANGSQGWYQNGQLHRLDGPAFEYADVTKYWYQEGKRHRLDGPACEYADGTKFWYIEGKELTEEEFLAKTKPAASCDGKVVEIEGKKYKLVEVKEI